MSLVFTIFGAMKLLLHRKLTICFVFLVALLFLYSCKQEKKPIEQPQEVVGPSSYLFDICIDSLAVDDYKIKNGDNLSSIFAGLGISAGKSDSITMIGAKVINPKKLRAGMSYFTCKTNDQAENLQYIIIEKSRTDYAIINLTKDSIRVYPFQKPITIKQQFVDGTIKSSLWNAIINQGGNPLLAITISDVFAWQIDFFGIQPDDSFEVLYSEPYIDDTTSLNDISIDGAVFIHAGKRYMAIPFVQDRDRKSVV